MKQKLLFHFFIIFSLCSNFLNGAVKSNPFSDFEKVPLAGNSFITKAPDNCTEKITYLGLENWTNSETIISTYFKVENAGNLSIAIKARFTSPDTVIKVTVNGVSQEVSHSHASNFLESIAVGDFNVSAGYVKVDLQGLTKAGDSFPDVTHILIAGEAASGFTIFCDDQDQYIWARRGPSAQLHYEIPTDNNVSYYYNEVTVPIGEDSVGSYFMANGFQDGYLGFQVNSDTERKILFSVWSSDLNSPERVSEDDQLTLNCKGENTEIGNFGEEGSGKQSYINYNWQAGTTYKFLLKGEPDKMGNTDYTAWFFASETNEWILIASWKKPHIENHLNNFYSFAENFIPENGYLGRKAEFANQWIRTSEGVWFPITFAKFTVDQTYTNNQRVDAIGGVSSNNAFYLRNGGFFNESENPETVFSVATPTESPNINIDDLPLCHTVVARSPIQEIKLYPNPSDHFIKIQGLNNEVHQYKILSMSHTKIVLSGTTDGNNEINISELPKGIYTIVLYDQNNTNIQALKFIKN
ncbi:DUF5077 domain-containing protein [Chryseobacterium nematophagum]|uniref:DUF5077 domain-containing protein n=1 Tax=Chryseobacterium nematophagum TaxID=2305228 RepID=A0A3M7THR0_9FLAO|nr:DUF3472 domain-containing protein [Chryseobacterium nematophagum]RNA63045.1 DUF5077 domain-containing protein [Chryseobacterium nematophagum]